MMDVKLIIVELFSLHFMHGNCFCVLFLFDVMKYILFL